MCKWRVSGGECNNRDVDIRGLSYWLVISTWISHNQKTGLTESSLDLIGECSWGETSCNRGSTSGRSKLKDSSLTIWTSRDDTNVSWVFNSSNGTSSQQFQHILIFEGENFKSSRHLGVDLSNGTTRV